MVKINKKMEKQMEEIWRPVRGFEDYAEISNYGQIHRFEREYYSGKNHKSKKVQEESWTYGSESSRGYLTATIGGVKKGVHVWVFMTFNDCDIPKGYEVNHIDEDKHRNCVWNLNLMTKKENIRWGTGIERSAASRRGRKRPAEAVARMAASKSKAVQALKPDTMEVVMEFPSAAEAKRQYGFDNSHISQCCRGKLKSYKGLIWRFAV